MLKLTQEVNPNFSVGSVLKGATLRTPLRGEFVYSVSWALIS